MSQVFRPKYMSSLIFELKSKSSLLRAVPSPVSSPLSHVEVNSLKVKYQVKSFLWSCQVWSLNSSPSQFSTLFPLQSRQHSSGVCFRFKACLFLVATCSPDQVTVQRQLGSPSCSRPCLVKLCERWLVVRWHERLKKSKGQQKWPGFNEWTLEKLWRFLLCGMKRNSKI